MEFIWNIFGEVSVHALVFHVRTRFRCAVGSGRGDGAANFAELDSDFSEPGKHVWTFDMADVLHVDGKFVRGMWVSISTSLLVRQRSGCSEVAMTSDERWPNHVVTWRAARWYCCSMPALCHPTFPTLTWLEPCYRPFPFPCYHMSHCQDTV